MLFGVARELITPYFKTNISCTGAFGVLFEGIHDDVYVKALVMDDGKTKALIIATDLLFHDRSLNKIIEDYAGARYRIPKELIIINHSHNHNAPSASGYDDAHVSRDYEVFLEERICRCIDRAFANTFEGDMAYGSVEAYFLNVNRRRKMEDGTIQNRPNPTGPKDSTIHILKVCDKKGRIRILTVIYSCHPATYPDLLEISSEYPGRLCHKLEDRFYGATALFLQGSGGNVKTNISSRGDRFVRTTYDDIDDMALILEQKIGMAIQNITFEKVKPELAGTVFAIPVEVEPAPREYFKNAIGQRPSKPLLGRNAEYILENYDAMANEIILHAGILKLSPDLCIAHMGGEPCYEISVIVKEAIGEDKKVIFSGYSDAVAYIPSDKLIGEGGYEVDSFLEYRFKGPFKTGIDALVRDAFKKGVETLF